MRKAWLVRKTMAHNPERPLFVIGIELASEPREGANAELVNRIAREVQLAADFFVVSLGGKNAELARRTKATAKAPFFERPRWWSRKKAA